MATEDDIRRAMKQVEDPELGVNVVDLGLLYKVNIDDAGNVILDMTLTSMGCPLTEQILGDARAAHRLGMLLWERREIDAAEATLLRP